MMLAETLHDALSRWQPADVPATFTHQSGDWSVAVDVDRADSIGCSIGQITCTRTAINAEPLVAGEWAKKIVSNSVGLLEPLRIIEVDSDRNEAILRSDSPRRKDNLAHYYELRLADKGTATVERYQADTKAGTARERVPFVLTHEVIGNLAGAVCV